MISVSNSIFVRLYYGSFIIERRRQYRDDVGVLDLQDSSALLPLTQYNAFLGGYLISNFPSIVRVLNLVSIRVEVIFESCNSLLRYSKMEFTSGLFFTANGADGFNDVAQYL